MSANRSVQAAQRRRAGPSNNEPAIPGRGPQPSINSAQMFANQARPGPGPNIPTGRIAGQQYQQQQQPQQQQFQQPYPQQYQQTQHYQQNQKNIDKLSSISKMTVPQAITLITLRLGALESRMMNSGEGFGNEYDGESGIDPSFLQDIVSRLETIEKQIVVLSTTNQNSNTNQPSPTQLSSTHQMSSSNQISDPNSELNLLKKQLETIKQGVIQSKNASLSLIKENSTLKSQLENLKKELLENKELISSLKDMTIDNSKKILNLSMATSVDYTTLFNENNLGEKLESTELLDIQETSGDDEIIGTDLKQLIESELNTDI